MKNIVIDWHDTKVSLRAEFDRVCVLVEEAYSSIKGECGQEISKDNLVKVQVTNYVANLVGNFGEFSPCVIIHGYKTLLYRQNECYHNEVSPNSHFPFSLSVAKKLLAATSTITGEMVRHWAEERLVNAG